MTNLPSNKRATGSSYCFNGDAGGEIFGGLTVSLRWKNGPTGTVVAPLPQLNRINGETLEENLVRELSVWAETGIREAGGELGADLTILDVELNDFAFHSVDSPLTVYREASAAAFRSAWDAWHRYGKRYFRRDS